VIRTVLTIAVTALAGVTLATSAEACISCEYVPEVVRQHSTLNAAPSYRRARSYAVRTERIQRARKRIAKRDANEKPVKTAKVEKSEKADKSAKVVKQAKASKAPKPIQQAKVHAAPVEKKPAVIGKIAKLAVPDGDENSRIENESSSITVASVEVTPQHSSKAVTASHESAAKPSDCKKFFASVGMTLTVPCE